MKVKFTKNEFRIINLLQNAKTFSSVENISEKVGISQRSIYKNLKSINEKLKKLGIEGTRNVYGHGYYFGTQSKAAISKFLKNEPSASDHISYSAEERLYLEYLELFVNHTFSIQTLVESLNVSRQTVLKDIHELSLRLKRYDIKLVSTPKGHVLEGLETQVRQFLFSMLFSNRKLSDLNKSKEVRELKSLIGKWINSFENTYNVIYSDEFSYTFEIFYALTLERIFNGNSLNKKNKFEKNIISTVEYKAASSFLPILLGDKYDSFETYYLATVLLGGQKRYISENSISKDIDKIVRDVIKSFKNLADCEFKNEDQLYRDLTVHLSTTFFRVKYRQQYQSTKFKLIKENYPDIYIYTQMSIHPFERLIGASLNDYEIGLISTYFASQIANKRISQNPQVLLVSSGSTGSSRFLLTQLVEQYPYVNFADPISNSQYLKMSNFQEEAIITTINLPSNNQIPILKVNSILTSEDLSNIDDFFSINGIATTANFQTEYKSIMDIVSDNTEIINNSALEDGIKQILLDRRLHKKIMEGRRKPLLSEVLTEDMIKFSHNSDLSWQDAIKLSAQPLIEAHKISPKYVEAIISNVNENGPYINIGPEIALAHARPDQGVKKLGMSLLLLDHDINLVDDKHKIKLIIVLAAADATSHLKALSELAQILGNKDDVNLIMKAKKSSEIEDLIKKGEKNETRSLL